ncbi:MAG: thioredoxin family protein [Proteobacteria bacterium]|nr:thioredoxin family protein [Pseudomonadota bacterium]
MNKIPANNIVYQEVNVLEQIDYVVSLGVLNTPAIAINGKLVFRSMPSPSLILKEIQSRITKV